VARLGCSGIFYWWHDRTQHHPIQRKEKYTMTESKIKEATTAIDGCTDKLTVLQTLFQKMRNDPDGDASFAMGLEKICSEVINDLLDVNEVLHDAA
jgi:hypothetical protein